MCVYVHVCVCIFVCVCVYICMCVCVHVYVYVCKKNHKTIPYKSIIYFAVDYLVTCTFNTIIIGHKQVGTTERTHRPAS